MTFLFQLFFAVVNTILRGVLIKTFWGWFILTQFKGLPDINVTAAIGFSMFIGAVTPWKSLTSKQLDDVGEDSTKMGFINAFLYAVACLLSLGMGYVIHCFM